MERDGAGAGAGESEGQSRAEVGQGWPWMTATAVRQGRQVTLKWLGQWGQKPWAELLIFLKCVHHMDSQSWVNVQELAVFTPLLWSPWVI